MIRFIQFLKFDGITMYWFSLVNVSVLFRMVEQKFFKFNWFHFRIIFFLLFFKGYLRLWNVRVEQFRTILHQLRQREVAATIQPARLQIGTGGVRPGEDQLDFYWLLWQPALYRLDRKASRYPRPPRRSTKYHFFFSFIIFLCVPMKNYH